MAQLSQYYNNAVETRTGKTITLAAMSQEAFADKFNGLKKKEADGKDPGENINNFVATFQLPTFDGRQFQNDDNTVSYGSNTANVTVNVAKCSKEFGPKYSVAGKEDGYTGSCVNGAPMAVKFTEDVSDNGPNAGVKVVVEMDLKAIATANHEEKKLAYDRDQELPASERRGIPMPNEADRERIPATYSFTNAKDGVAGINENIVAKNIGKYAGQRYLHTASAKNPNQGLPTAEVIDTVAKAYTNVFSRVMQECIDGKANKDMKTTGKGKSGKGTISNSAVSAPSFEIQAVEVDGATVYAIKSDAPTKTVNDWLRSASTRINREWSQEIGKLSEKAGSGFEKGSLASKIANEISADCYAVSPKDSDMLLVQPAMRGTSKVFASKLTDAYRVYTHQEEPSKVYGAEVLANAASLADTYNQGSGRSREEALEAAKQQLSAIKEATGPSK
jgi:hypothetical protein